MQQAKGLRASKTLHTSTKTSTFRQEFEASLNASPSLTERECFTAIDEPISLNGDAISLTALEGTTKLKDKGKTKNLNLQNLLLEKLLKESNLHSQNSHSCATSPRRKKRAHRGSLTIVCSENNTSRKFVPPMPLDPSLCDKIEKCKNKLPTPRRQQIITFNEGQVDGELSLAKKIKAIETSDLETLKKNESADRSLNLGSNDAIGEDNSTTVEGSRASSGKVTPEQKKVGKHLHSSLHQLEDKQKGYATVIELRKQLKEKESQLELLLKSAQNMQKYLTNIVNIRNEEKNNVGALKEVLLSSLDKFKGNRRFEKAV